MKDKYYNKGWFGRHPAVYEKMDIFMRVLRRKAAKKIPYANKLNTLDIATGTGAQAYEFAKLGHDVVGIDLDSKMLEKAEKKRAKFNNLTFIQGDGTNLPFKPETYDLVVISFAMHDVPYEIGVKILSEAKRVVKGTGKVYIIDYAEQQKNIWASLMFRIALIYETKNYKPFIKRGLDNYLAAVGLKKIKEEFLFGAVQLTLCEK